MFTGYLTQKELQELMMAAVAGDAVSLERGIRLATINRPYVLGMQVVASPLDQFNLELVTFNGVERLEGGQVPLEVFLENIAFRLKLLTRPEAEVFSRYANVVHNRASGVARLPAPSLVP
jgi:hypothetical protein